jgi:xanthosine utilization system XapX-like protein
MNVSCPNCGATVGEQIGGKLGIGLAAALLGSRVNPAAALVFGLLGALVGHQYIDRAIRTCPQCGMVLRIIGDLPL